MSKCGLHPMSPAWRCSAWTIRVARRACEAAGFRLVIDAGLGPGHRDFRGIRIRTFPGPSKAAQLWAATVYDGEVPWHGLPEHA